MSMERSRRVAEIWNWLPAFRVVAEYESIHKASSVLHVSASSLSRTIRLLEEAVGAPLFLRSVTGLSLTAYGATLLEGTRDALRRMDDAIAVSPGATSRSSCVVAGASGAVLPELLARSVARLAGDTRFRLVEVDEALAADELLRGNLDVALVDACGAEAPKDVLVERLGELTLAIHARDGARHGDVVAPDGVADVGSARIVASAPSLGAVLRIAEDASAGAVLPIGLAPAGFRVVAELAARVAVYAMRRRSLGTDEGAPRDVIEAARAMVAAPAPPR